MSAVERLGYGTVTDYERYISIPAARARMTETDWIVARALDAAYEQASWDQPAKATA